MGRGMAIGLGVVAGGLLGAATRPAVIYAFWLRGADADTVRVLVFVSAGIGLAVGGISALIAAPVRGAWASPIVGALGGAVLAYLVTVLSRQRSSIFRSLFRSHCQRSHALLDARGRRGEYSRRRCDLVLRRFDFLPLISISCALDFTFPPIFFPFGHNPSHEAKCLTVGHFVKSGA